MNRPRKMTAVAPLTLNPIAPTSNLCAVFDDLPLNRVAGQLAQEGEALDVVVDFEGRGAGLLGIDRLHVREPTDERQQVLLDRLADPADVAVVLDGPDRPVLPRHRLDQRVGRGGPAGVRRWVRGRGVGRYRGDRPRDPRSRRPHPEPHLPEPTDRRRGSAEDRRTLRTDSRWARWDSALAARPPSSSSVCSSASESPTRRRTTGWSGSTRPTTRTPTTRSPARIPR